MTHKPLTSTQTFSQTIQHQSTITSISLSQRRSQDAKYCILYNYYPSRVAITKPATVMCEGDALDADGNSNLEAKAKYDVTVDANNKATEFKALSLKRPHMRTFYVRIMCIYSK
eukprot:scaffold39137_cov169-Skeletonema_marinoi.AAC.2